MRLQDILYRVGIRSVIGKTDISVKDIQIDSRKVQKGSVFIAVKGAAVDGHQFIDKAIESGAVAVIADTMPSATREAIVYVQVDNSAAAAGYMAHNFFGQPSEKMAVVGVTGTNGKTTIATLLFKLFTSLGYKCGLLSTVENHIGDRIIPA